MDFHLKQWRQHESEPQQQEPQHPVKMPKLLLDNNNNNNHSQQYSSSAPLPLFVPDDEIPTCKISHLSAFSDSTSPSPKMGGGAGGGGGGGGGSGGGGYFSWAQRQELELQALIYKYMLAGATVPPELLQPIRKSLPYFLHHPIQHYSYYQPALLQTGYWGRAATDPEPGRCRRTDGKKWRCSRDVVAGQKYCERHVHRGRNRSRKPVEIPTPVSATSNSTAAAAGGGGGGGGGFNNSSSIHGAVVNNNGNNNNSGGTFCFTGQSSSSSASATQFLHHPHNNGPPSETQFQVGVGRDDGRILRHFFDDWPRSDSDSHGGNTGGGGGGQMNSVTCLSISMPGNMTSDVSLKLATGDGEELPEREVQQPQYGGWGSAHHVASMGGPLAEALRSSISNSSPTSVLHHLPRGSASETSFVSA
ncbi:growth-regulating factor 3-like [Euphorbia lathyris]|uniref:growth-regulating factor 3-like n=1 Tax=Euphorbia lathyris TaxID=212925 RepID=UPI003313F44C